MNSRFSFVLHLSAINGNTYEEVICLNYETLLFHEHEIQLANKYLLFCCKTPLTIF